MFPKNKPQNLHTNNIPNKNRSLHNLRFLRMLLMHEVHKHAYQLGHQKIEKHEDACHQAASKDMPFVG